MEGQRPAPPLAPASLVLEDPAREVLPLHRLVADDGDLLTFESYDVSEALPAPQEAYGFQSWWRPDQFEAVTRTDLAWKRATVPSAEDDLDCLLTWARLDPETEAYLSSEGEWISIVAYERYIRDDALRVRGRRPR